MSDSASGCSFCARTRADVIDLVSGPRVAICNYCVEAANKVVDAVAGDDLALFEECTFCGHSEARGQYAGSVDPSVRVCDTCICLCVEVIAEQRAQRTLPQARLVKG